MAPLFLALAAGCTSVKVTGTARTGTEQLLLTGTWDDALYRVNFHPLAGAKVFLDGQYVTHVDKDYVLSSIRRTMLEQGVLLETNKDKAQVILEPSFGAYGTDQRDTTTGLPGVGLGTSLTGPALTSNGSSSLNFTQTNRQDAVVKASLFAYEAKTGRTGVGIRHAPERPRAARPLRIRPRPLPPKLARRGRAVSRRVASPDPQAPPAPLLREHHPPRNVERTECGHPTAVTEAHRLQSE